jgi:asparagine synthase (glutamine-hydrolysing)
MAGALAPGGAPLEAVCVRNGTAAIGAVGGRHRQTAAVSLASGPSERWVAVHGDVYEIAGKRTRTLDGPALARVLLERLDLRGRAFLAELRGDWSLAIWDGRRGELLIAIDGFRVQPLFVYEDDDCLLFASRLRSLVASGRMRNRTLEPEAIIDVVASSYIASPGTVFREALKVPPGHAGVWRDGRMTLEAYWDLSFLEPEAGSEADLARTLKERFREAVALRVPEDTDPGRLGVFLSGGIDSSTVTGVLTEVTGRPARSFSIGFAEPRFNELEYARLVARAFGSEHHEYSVTPADTADILPVLLEWFDEPFANASAVPTYYCARLAREHGVEVMLAGDGGDELFAGNPWYASPLDYEPYRRLPRWLSEGLLRPSVRAAARTGLPIFGKMERYVERARLSYPDRLATYSLFRQVPLAELFTSDFLGTLARPYVPHRATRRHYGNAPARNDLDRLLYIDLKLVIGDNDLVKVTRMTEAAGVAVRFPVLDGELARFATAVPARVKMPGRDLRTFFKSAYADLLPPETRAKRKHGFGLPIPIWLKTDRRLNDLMHELVLGPATAQRGIFRRQGLEELVRRHAEDTSHYYGPMLWNVMLVELWLRSNA